MAAGDTTKGLYPSTSPDIPPYKLTTIYLPSPFPEGTSTPIATLLPPSLSSTLFSTGQLPPFATPYPDDPSYEVLDTPTKGFGMFATRSIEAGELILNEHPVLIVPEIPLPHDSPAWDDMGLSLPEKQRTEMLTMANCRPVEECPSSVEGIVRTNALVLDLIPRTKKAKRQPGDNEMVPVQRFGGVFLKINRCNHSCGPNAAHKWDISNLSSKLYALRKIQPGEEITIFYTDVTQSRDIRRAELEKNHRFLCTCLHCSPSSSVAPEVEASIYQSDENRHQLRHWLSTHPSYLEDVIQRWANVALPGRRQGTLEDENGGESPESPRTSGGGAVVPLQQEGPNEEEQGDVADWEDEEGWEDGDDWVAEGEFRYLSRAAFVSAYNSNQADFVAVEEDVGLFEVKAKTGHEMHALLTMTKRCLFHWSHSSLPRPHSIVWREDFGNRLYIETDNIETARAACLNVVTLQHYRHPEVKVVDRLDAAYLIRRRVMAKPSVQIGGWIRIAHGKYKGDIAYVFDVKEEGVGLAAENTLSVLLVPRIDHEAIIKRCQRQQLLKEHRARTREYEARMAENPEARLVPPRPPTPPPRPSRKQRKNQPRIKQGLLDASRVPPSAIERVPANKRLDLEHWKADACLFDASGFLLQRGLGPLQYSKDPATPSLEELEWFSRCANVAPDTLSIHLRRMELESMSAGTHVRVRGEEAVEWDGMVQDMYDDVIVVRERGSIYQRTVERKYVYRWFYIGDRVQVAAGPCKSLVAWVVYVNSESRIAVIQDLVKQETTAVSFHYLTEAPDDRIFHVPSTSDKGKKRMNVPDVPQTTVNTPIRLQKHDLLKYLVKAEVVVDRGEHAGRKGRVAAVKHLRRVSVVLEQSNTAAGGVVDLRARRLHYRFDPAGPYFRLDADDLVLYPVPSKRPPVLYQKLKGMSVLARNGAWKERRGRIHSIEETGRALVDFDAANTSGSKLQEISAEDLLYQHYPGGPFFQLDEKKELVPAPEAGHLVKSGFVNLDDHPRRNDPDYYISPQRLMTTWGSILSRQADMEENRDLDGDFDTIPAGHYFNMLQQRVLKEKPGLRIFFKVREDLPALRQGAGKTGYFSGIEGSEVRLTSPETGATFKEHYQALVPAPLATKTGWVVVCDNSTEMRHALGAHWYVREVRGEVAHVYPSSHNKTDIHVLKTWQLARTEPAPRVKKY
ncbi:hypothetical protein NP233_g3557 [Leucocoprinus birnbaumii]|uniref:SET domain-containing protein n=1 Tax=Leucocoprinus birnbaumii TaxID=56174 RepID=A0AAD5VWD1_9AGAR|nr:hypothetical protein NP233_g3557 [Leucocoprinus birnbaumii]